MFRSKLIALSVAIVMSVGSSLAVAPANALTRFTWDGSVVDFKRGDGTVSVQGDLTVNVATVSDPLGIGLIDQSDSTNDSSCYLPFYGDDLGAHYIDISPDGDCGGIPLPDRVSETGLYDLVIYYGINWYDPMWAHHDVIQAGLSLPQLLYTTSTFALSKSSVVQGATVSVTPQAASLWSDGVTTKECTDQATLQTRVIGTSAWVSDPFDDLGQTRGCPQTFSGTPMDSADYRIVIDTHPSASQYLNVVKPTLAYRVTPTTTNLSTAMFGATATFSANAETQYDDSVWRSSPVGTRYSLQFVADGDTAWATIASSRVASAGTLTVRAPVTASGHWRFTAGSATSTSTVVSVVVPTSVVALDDPTLPTTVISGALFTLTDAVEVQYSDSNYYDAPVGTEFSVEFTTDTPSASLPSNLVGAGSAHQRSLRPAKWYVVAKGKISTKGKVKASLRASKTGYWRVVVKKHQSKFKRVVVKARR